MLFNSQIVSSAMAVAVVCAIVMTSISAADEWGGRAESMRITESDSGRNMLSLDETCEPQWVPNFIGEDSQFVFALTMFDDGLGGGPALYAGGSFTMAGGVIVNRVAKWDGNAWLPLGTGTNGDVWSFEVFDDGNGPALYVGGLFSSAGGIAANNIAKWDGTSWSALGNGTSSIVRAMTVFDTGLGAGPALFVGGAFATAGGVQVNGIARWNGTSWSKLDVGMNDVVLSLAVYSGGAGGTAALYAGGGFTTAGGEPANRIARWDGTEWAGPGIGITNPGGEQPARVSAMQVFDDGSGDGPALYVAGHFSRAGVVNANNIAKRLGTNWYAVGSGVEGVAFVEAMTVLDDGAGDGPALYAAGFFTLAGGAPVNHIAKWDGTMWSPLGNGVNSLVWALTSTDEGASTPALYAGGFFTMADDMPSHRVAEWRGCDVEPQCLLADLNCDGVVDVSDLLVQMNAWGTCPGSGTCAADLNGDGTVDVSDMLVLLGLWG